MKKLSLFLTALLMLGACQNQPKGTVPAEPEDTDTIIVDADQYLLMETSEGNITFKLYRETPLHRHNFVKLARKGYYNNQQFYRIQNNFTVQAGDPKSKGATRETPLGEGDVDYTIPEEIQPEKFYHKRGALAMASYYKMEKSSGGQFYIVTGFKYSDTKLFNAEDKYNKELRKQVFDSITLALCRATEGVCQGSETQHAQDSRTEKEGYSRHRQGDGRAQAVPLFQGAEETVYHYRRRCRP